ncbi:MAG: hypothetical protein ACLFS1_11555 [Opitutales bacterium]
MLFEKDAEGRLKRIEYRGRHLRASRTGGVALRAQTRAAGINLTANTARGTRVSTRLAKGTQGAFQNGRFILRGRYGDGPTKLNLSKSGVSVSSKTDIGTINWFKPGYSSAKIGGVQVRGKNAVYLHLIVGLFQIAAYLLLFLAQALVLLLQGLYWLGMQTWAFGKWCYQAIQAKRLEPVESKWMRQLEAPDLGLIEMSMDLIFFKIAAGGAITVDPQLPESTSSQKEGSRIAATSLIQRLLSDTTLKPPGNLELLFGCLAKVYAEKSGESDCIEKLLTLDEEASQQVQRTRLQDRLLGVYAESCGIEASGFEG